MKNSQENVKEKPYQLVIDHVREEVLHGNLRPGDRLPGERELAEQLGISRNSVSHPPSTGQDTTSL